MGRLRANLQNSAIDRLVQSEVSSAQRAVARAIRACRGAKSGPDVNLARLRRVVRDLSRAGSALASVGSVASSFDTAGDVDKMSEEDRSTQFWAERAEREAARQAEADAANAEAYAVENDDGAAFAEANAESAVDEGGE